MDQHETNLRKPEDDFIHLSTTGNTLTVTIAESSRPAITDFCFRVKTQEDFNKLDWLVRQAIKANVILVLDPENGKGKKRKTLNYSFKETLVNDWR